MNSLAIVILAGGIGKRMKSSLPKVLHKLCGKPMLFYSIHLTKSINPEKLLVIAPKDERVLNFLSEERVDFAIQEKPLGTGDAVKKAELALSDFKGDVLILPGDVPLLTKGTVLNLIREHRQKNAELTVLTSDVPDPSSYGRIVRQGDQVIKIVEDSDATLQEKHIKEINTGIYVFKKESLFSTLREIKTDNVQKEYYLTDTLEIMCKKGLKVISCKSLNYKETLGINTRKALSEVNRYLQTEIIEKLQIEGVTFENPLCTTIDYDVKIGKDTTIYSNVSILGSTEIGENCSIGQNSIIIDSKISSGTCIGECVTIKNACLG